MTAPSFGAALDSRRKQKKDLGLLVVVDLFVSIQVWFDCEVWLTNARFSYF